MFRRFVIDYVDTRSGRRAGLFFAAYGACRTGICDPVDTARIADELLWFDRYLARPTRFERRSLPRGGAICWFRASAREHVRRARNIAVILENYGIRVDMLTTRRPGYIVYEDSAQVAAYPFSETRY